MMWRVLVLVVAVTTTACGELPLRSADVDGVVTEVDVSTLRVESGPTATTVRITGTTRLYRDIGGVLQPIVMGDVRAGPLQRARAWFANSVVRPSATEGVADVVLVWTLAP